MNKLKKTGRAGYAVVCVDMSDDLGRWKPDLDDPNLRQYGEIAHAAIIAAGTPMVKLTPPEPATVVMGEWPGNHLLIQRYDSLERLRKFWTSELYQQAVAARQKSPLNPIVFALGFEGCPASELPENDPSRSWSLSVVDEASTIDASSPSIVAIANSDDVYVAEGINPFPGKTLVVQLHNSTDAATAAAPMNSALLHVFTSGGTDT